MLSSIIFSLYLLHTASGGNLLMLHFIPTGSSVSLINGILNTLAPYHNITVYSVLMKTYPHPNVTVEKLDIQFPNIPFLNDTFRAIREYDTDELLHNLVTVCTEENIHTILNSTKMQSLIRTDEKYDLVFELSFMSEFAYPFAHLFGIPLIQIAPSMLFPYSNDIIGSSAFQTSTYSAFNFEKSFNFFSRLKIYMNHIIHYIKYKYQYLPLVNKIVNKYFPPYTPRIEELQLNTSLWLENVNRGLGYVKPSMPHLLDIGGIHCKPPKPLASDLEEFISGAGDNGIIYVSFGSWIGGNCPEYFKNSLINVFSKLPQRILWKWKDEIYNLPPNVRVSKWFSQQDILGHKKTKLFITQGGILSLQESVYHKTPILVIPIVFDQFYNSHLANHLGYGEYIHFKEFKEEQFEYYIHEILSNSKYKENVIRISKLMQEELQTVNDTLRNSIDYIIRHNGNPIIQQVPYKLTGIQRMDVDIVIFFVLIIILGIYITLSITKFLFKLHKFNDKLKKL